MMAAMNSYNPDGLLKTRARAALVAALLGLFSATLAAAASAADQPGAADASPPADASGADLDTLRRRLEQEEERIRELERRLAADEAAQAPQRAVATPPSAVPPAGPQPPPSPQYAAPAGASALAANFGSAGFTLESADGANVIHFRGNLSVDGRYYSDAYTPETDDTWLIRKLRPTLEGTLWSYFDFRFMPDFGEGKTVLQDAWGDARVAPWLVFQFGKFKAPVGLERLQLEQFARFIEASLPSDLLPYRDLGFKLGGNVAGGIINYDLGIFDGTTDGGSTDGNSVPDADASGRFATEARLFLAPFLHAGPEPLKKLGFGVAETYVKDGGVATPSSTTSLLATYKTPGQQNLFAYRADTLTATASFNNATIAHGIERRLDPQLYYYDGPLGLMSEYASEQQQVERQISALSTRAATLDNNAWQVQAYWFITGEDEGYDTAAPRRNFGQGGLGAFELVARYHAIHFDHEAFSDGADSFASPTSSARAAHAIGTGVNWYPNGNFKVQLDYEVTHFDGGATRGPTVIDRPAERVLTSQFALIF